MSVELSELIYFDKPTATDKVDFFDEVDKVPIKIEDPGYVLAKIKSLYKNSAVSTFLYVFAFKIIQFTILGRIVIRFSSGIFTVKFN
jgi:hypothetical protein